jgi:hypothetical protein
MVFQKNQGSIYRTYSLHENVKEGKNAKCSEDKLIIG